MFDHEPRGLGSRFPVAKSVSATRTDVSSSHHSHYFTSSYIGSPSHMSLSLAVSARIYGRLLGPQAKKLTLFDSDLTL